MRYVLDASVALCWVIPRPLSPSASRLRDDYCKSLHQLIAPSIFPAETASGLTKAERQKLIPVGDARPLLAKILRTLPALHPYGRLLHRATDISSGTRSGLYDCLYVALAEREQCELVTADDKLVRNLQPQFPFIISLAFLP
jgi:predicted nucleic acid-binding protein